MERSTKDAWLNGPGDLTEATVEDVPVPGVSVKVRGLPAAYSNEAQSKALELKTGARGEQTATINTAKLEVLQFTHGVVEPTFTEPEAQLIAQKYAHAWRKVINKIDELSAIDKEAIQRANEAFQVGGEEPANGRATGTSSVAAGSG